MTGLQTQLLVVVLVLALVEVAVPGVTPLSDLAAAAADVLTPDWGSLLPW